MSTDDHKPWGEFAPSGLFKFCLDRSQIRNSKAWARLAGLLAPEYTDVERLGFKARLHPADNLSEKRLLLTPDRFDPVELVFLSEQLKPGFVFVDIGANCGAYSLHLVRKASADSRFFAIEAQPEMARRFRFNANANEIPGTIILDQIALSDRPGTLTFQINQKNRGESRLGDGAESIEVEAQTFTDYLRAKGLSRIDALKIDVEGFEYQILSPFFETTPETLWPRSLIVEQILASPETDPVTLARTKGYTVAHDLGRNVILTLDPTQ